MRRLALAALACLLPASPVIAQRTPVRLVQKVAPGQLLEVDLDSGASLKIVGWDRAEVSVTTSDAEADCPDAVISLDDAPRGARLETYYPPETGDVHECSLALEVRVPRRFDVRIRSTGGDVSVAGLRGSVDGHTAGGSLELVGVNGQARLRTGGGEILVRDSDLDGRLNTGGGGVHFENVRGGITATSGSVRGVTRARPRSS